MKYLLISCLFLLGACSQTVQPQVVKVTYPDELLYCSDYPKVEVYKQQSDVALFIVDLDQSYWDCKNKLDGLANVVKEKK